MYAPILDKDRHGATARSRRCPDDRLPPCRRTAKAAEMPVVERSCEQRASLRLIMDSANAYSHKSQEKKRLIAGASQDAKAVPSRQTSSSGELHAFFVIPDAKRERGYLSLQRIMIQSSGCVGTTTASASFNMYTVPASRHKSMYTPCRLAALDSFARSACLPSLNRRFRFFQGPATSNAKVPKHYTRPFVDGR
ncbi:hypothetical protein COCC4DRAFT_143255 [Bipolaris maydis ATCC 48331]|uniref:Uncharacterized protein n=2 Tax=Cochliobolus heterostrophus TaxID=5016 RepID=M2SRP2_COCH5|nr:uncharacterized protein COCC4DRAFT_143255 [Bipolaris maydis ATCC 48331]EMD87975.1 hypothetical protein COCHEDRAFT_1033338 [Bipolaris maydis C5]ENI03491.1 hypothetical protein COCC4DRAFT_143255 [Bipolaris maydis ATCC 48331]